MPDSELKNCKEAGLFLLAVDRGGDYSSVFSLGSMPPFFCLVHAFGFHGYRWHIGGFIWFVFVLNV